MKKIIVLCWSIIMVLTFTACVRFEVRGKANTTKLSSEEIEINKSVVFEGENKIDIIALERTDEYATNSVTNCDTITRLKRTELKNSVLVA